MSLKEYSVEELTAELLKREDKVPILRSYSDVEFELENFMADFHKWFTLHIHEKGCEPKDYEHYSFEMMIEFLYGKDYWDWYDKVIE